MVVQLDGEVVAKDEIRMIARRMRSVIQIIGTTGVGKSQLSIDLASHFHGEIINSDSMQVYAGLDIITNKHPVNERKGIKHHLLGFLEPDKEYSIGEYQADATKIIDRLHEEGKTAVVVGGTAYYATSLLFNDMLIKSSNTEASEARQEGEMEDARLEKETSELYADLQRIDPIMATRWHPRDRRKIRRSLQIYYETGKRQSELYTAQQEVGRHRPEDVKFRTLFIWLYADQKTLDDRLDARIDEMIRSGLFDEIKGVKNEGEVDYTKGIYQAIGYKEFQNYLAEPTEATKLAGTERMKAATRRYARKQVKWIRNKLLLQIGQAGPEVELILLDATDLAAWSTSVRQPAVDAVAQFVREDKFDDKFTPRNLSAMLVPAREQEFSSDRESWRRRYDCDLCLSFSCNTEAGWREHLESNGHRQKIKQAKKRAEFELWKARQSNV